MTQKTNWFAIILWFLTSAIASTYLNTAFLLEFEGDALALTLIRFVGSALLGFITNLFTNKGITLQTFPQLFQLFLLPAMCLLFANLFNSISLNRGGITLTYVIKAGIPLVTVLICLFKGQHVSIRLIVTLIPTVIGVALSSLADTEFSLDGFIAAWISTFSQALLNVSSKQSILTSNLTGQSSQFLLVTIASIGMIILDLTIKSINWTKIYEKSMENEKSLFILIFVAIGYHVEYVFNFIVTGNVSEVYFSVLDVARRLSIILAGAIMFGKELSIINIFGVFLALFGVLAFSQVKRFEEESKNQEKLRKNG